MLTRSSLNRRAFSSWQLYLISTLYVATVIASWGYAYFNLFLKSLRNADGSATWTVSQVNSIPIAASAINVMFGESASTFSSARVDIPSDTVLAGVKISIATSRSPNLPPPPPPHPQRRAR